MRRSAIGHGPELADQQRLDALEGVDEALRGRRLEPAVRVLDVGPRQPHRARRAALRALAQNGELPVEAGRQVRAHLVQHVLDDVEVVHQPIRRRHGGALLVDDGGEGPVAPEQDTAVVLHAGEQRGAGRLAARDAVAGDGRRELLEPLDAQELTADRIGTEECHRTWARGE